MQTISERTRNMVHMHLDMAPGGLAARGLLAASAVAQEGTAEPSPFETVFDVLNYALTLEHLEATFYNNGLDEFSAEDFPDIGFQTSVYDRLTEVRDHEVEHVSVLTSVISDLGGIPVAEADYDFGYTTLPEFLSVAMALENTGVDAYTGAAQYLINYDLLLTAALTIHGVEARHAAYFNMLNAVSPFPDAFDEPLSPAEVLEIAQPFIVERS